MNNFLPIFVMRDLVVFPKQTTTVEVGRDISIKTIEKSIEDYDGQIIITLQKDSEKNITKTNMFNFGTIARITKIENMPSTPNGRLVTLEVQERVLIKKINKNEEIYMGEFQIVEDTNIDDSENIELLEGLNRLILEEEIMSIKESDRKNLEATLESASLPQYIDFLSTIIPIEIKIKLEMLKETNVSKRISILNDVLSVKRQKLDNQIKKNPYLETQTQNEIKNKVNTKLSKQQREFYLREQLKIIKEELNEISGEENEFDSMRKQINDNPYPEHIKVKLLAELKRLETIPAMNAESNIIRNYIEWLMDIPYWQETKEINDIEKARQVLDEGHYGLDKPKNRIIEFLAQKQKVPEAKPTVICFIGPPGTGKTSLSKGIAEALNRKFIKISLGGVKDEAEIRGHRKTYIASSPGKIVQAMKKVGVNNPVILLDEIDKMSSDYKGDPASAMLEVLDYEQNSHFQDHFIEEEYDLSKVMFIATANSYDEIPAALYDRMEVITLSSYTELEKLNIAKNYLVKRVQKETNLPKKLLSFNKETLLFIIRHYTMEAGVRQLHRQMLNISRKLIVKELKDKNALKGYKVTPKEVVELLGNEKFEFTRKNDSSDIGVVTGLAWTSYGGDILPIEVTIYAGKGELLLTGQQRDVMKESANIALGFIKSHAKEFGIPKKQMINGEELDTFSECNIHVHVPDGATPKDGPSAGITFTTALISALTNKPVSQNIGMTGEITLRGKVFPIGGLREKSISAYRSGLKSILIPKKNLKDLEEIPQEVLKALTITPVENYKDVFEIIFQK